MGRKLGNEDSGGGVRGGMVWWWLVDEIGF